MISTIGQAVPRPELCRPHEADLRELAPVRIRKMALYGSQLVLFSRGHVSQEANDDHALLAIYLGDRTW